MDKTELYKKEIEPLVRSVKKICYDNGIPMFFAAAVKDDGTTTSYKNEMVSCAIAKQPLSEDRIAKMVNVVIGYDVMLPTNPIEIDYDTDVADNEYLPKEDDQDEDEMLEEGE